MAKNWALVIGINGYNPLNFSPLRYAKQDAEQVKALFEEIGFDEICLFTDDSPDLNLPNGISIPTRPTYGNLITFLEDRFKNPFLSTGDNCWFFFAGHGERHGDKDYLMPMDANSRGTKVLAGLQVDQVREWLTRSGADNVILLLDACRNEGSRGSQGIDPSEQKGVITISSCNPTQKAWEIEELQHGAFTYALLEALRLPGERSCATVERLGNYVKYRVPDLCQQYRKVPPQLPRVHVDPLEKQHFILMPQFARQADIDLMKKDGFRLAFEGNVQLAEQMFIRANVAARGLDAEIIQALRRLYIQMASSIVEPPAIAPPTPNEPPTARSPIVETSVGEGVGEAIAQTTTEQPTVRGEDPPLNSWEDVAKDANQSSGADKTNVYIESISQYLDTQVSRHSTEEAILEAIYHKPQGEILNIKTIAQQLKLSQSEVDRCLARFISQGCFQTFGSTLDGDTFIKVLPKGQKMLADRFVQASLGPQDDLCSEKGIDYTKLRDLLQAQDWKAADYETYLRMLEVVGRKGGDWIRDKELLSFPCADLKTIDGLWVKYSQGHFGFSVQKKIYLECGGKLDGKYPGDKVWEAFGDRVGWRKNDKWLPYNNLNPDLSSSSQGIFPTVEAYLTRGISSLASRLVNCSR